MNITNLLKRNGGRIRYRQHPMPTRLRFKCQFCDNARVATKQIVEVWGNRRKPVAWTWICDECAKIVETIY